GEDLVWTTASGERMVKHHLVLRGLAWDTVRRIIPGSDGLPAAYRLTGKTPQGDASETFDLSLGVARWRSPADSGSKSASGHGYYFSFGG
ncbi:hypothetical protein ABTH13_20195, partial [Acinetobacter baumannii]